MWTGLYQPSSGTAFICGFDMRTSMQVVAEQEESYRQEEQSFSRQSKPTSEEGGSVSDSRRVSHDQQ